MTPESARATVRDCLAAVKPQLDLAAVADDAPLLDSRVISSFDLLELILHLEQARGAPITREHLQPGSFRNIATIARVFLEAAGSRCNSRTTAR